MMHPISAHVAIFALSHPSTPYRYRFDLDENKKIVTMMAKKKYMIRVICP
jgi:hypothetical protein